MKIILIIVLIFCFNISFSQTNDAEKIKKEQIEKQKQQSIEDNSKKMNAASEANYKKYLEEKEKKQNAVKYSSTQQGAKPIAPNLGNTGNEQMSDNKDVQGQPDFSKMSASEKQAFEKQKQQNIEDASKKMNAESEANYKKYLEEKENVEKQNSIKYSSTQKGAKAIGPNTNNSGNTKISENNEAQQQADFSKMSASEKQAFEKQKQQNIEDAGKKMNAASDANYKKYLEEQERFKKQTKSQGSTSTKMAGEKK